MKVRRLLWLPMFIVMLPITVLKAIHTIIKGLVMLVWYGSEVATKEKQRELREKISKLDEALEKVNNLKEQLNIK